MRLAVIASLALAAVPLAAASAERLQAGPADGHVVVNVYKAGLFSGFAHDHHFAVSRWAVSADAPGDDLRRASLDVVLSSGSLHDTQKALSEGDRRKVDAQAAGPDGVDAAHFPVIEFRSERIEVSAPAPGGAGARGTIHGTLTLRGRSLPLDVPFEVDRSSRPWKVRGSVRVKQSTLGIKPYSGFGGTVKVKDELEIEFAFSLGVPD